MGSVVIHLQCKLVKNLLSLFLKLGIAGREIIVSSFLSHHIR